MPYGNRKRDQLHHYRCFVHAIYTKQNECVKNDIHPVFNDGCTKKFNVNCVPCCDLIGAATIVAAHTNECNVCHQTLYNMHPHK